jgi:hypothetical protein
MSTRLSLKTVNDQLERLGHAERLAKAGNYFLFTGGAADEWLDRTVGVRTINTKTLKEWIGEFNRLKALNEQMLGTLKKGGRAARRDSSPKAR